MKVKQIKKDDMKNIIFILLTMVLCACSSDDSKYGSHEAIHLTVEGLRPDYRGIRYEPFKIELDKIGDEVKNQKYEWRINNNVVSQKKDLNIILDQEYGQKKGCFIVTDSVSGMRYFNDFVVEIVSPYTSGIYILSDNGVKGELSFLSWVVENAKFKQGVFEVINGEEIGQNPKTIAMDRMYDKKDYIAILASGDRKIRMINPNTMVEEKAITGDSFYDPINDFVPTYLHTMDNTSSVLIQNGKMYPFATGEGASKIPKSANVITDYYAHDWFGHFSATSMIGFDKTNRKFFRMYSGSIAGGFKNMVLIGEEHKDVKILAGSKDFSKVLRVLLMDTVTLKASIHKFPTASTMQKTADLAVGTFDKESVATLGAISVYWYFSKGNFLYKMDVNGVEVPTEVVQLNSRDKIITNIVLSSKEDRAYVSYYDKVSNTTELKGGLAIVDLKSGEILEDYPNVAYKPVSILVRE